MVLCEQENVACSPRLRSVQGWCEGGRALLVSYQQLPLGLLALCDISALLPLMEQRHIALSSLGAPLTGTRCDPTMPLDLARPPTTPAPLAPPRVHLFFTLPTLRLLCRPLSSRTYLLDAALHLVPRGAVGRLWVALPSLRAEYAECPRRFVANPFAAGGGGGAVEYGWLLDAGLLAQWMPDGSMVLHDPEDIDGMARQAAGGPVEPPRTAVESWLVDYVKQEMGLASLSTTASLFEELGRVAGLEHSGTPAWPLLNQRAPTPCP